MQLIFFPALEYFVVFEENDIELYDFLRKNKWNYFFIIIMGWLVGGLYEEIVFHGAYNTIVITLIYMNYL